MMGTAVSADPPARSRHYQRAAEYNVLDGTVQTGNTEFQENAARMRELVQDLEAKVAEIRKGKGLGRPMVQVLCLWPAHDRRRKLASFSFARR